MRWTGARKATGPPKGAPCYCPELVCPPAGQRSGVRRCCGVRFAGGAPGSQMSRARAPPRTNLTRALVCDRDPVLSIDFVSVEDRLGPGTRFQSALTPTPPLTLKEHRMRSALSQM